MYKWVGVGVEGIVGVPAEDLTDKEFVKYSAKVNAQHSADQIGALANSGLYEYVEDEKPKVAKAEKAKEDEVIQKDSEEKTGSLDVLKNE